MNHITTMATAETQRRRSALKRKLAELQGSGVAREELQIEHLADPLDQILSNADRELALQSVDHKVRRIHEIQLALEAIEQGTYGVCEHCEETIPGRRLDAVPWARLCVPCQSAEEVERHEQVAFADAA